MKKIIIIVSVLLLTGCNVESVEAEPRIKYIQNHGKFEFYVDEETCVEYIEDTSSYGKGLTPRLNSDGTPIVNEVCLKDKE